MKTGRPIRKSLSFLMLAGLAAGCGDMFQTLNSASEDAIRYGSDETIFEGSIPEFRAARTVIVSRCANCHSDFSTYNEATWISKQYVDPGNTSGSTLYNRLRGAGTGGQANMPPDSALSLAEIQAIEAWIDAL